MPRKIIVIPQNYVRVNREQLHTRHIMNAQTGQMEGRRNVTPSQSDHTNVLRMIRDFDVNKDKKIDDRDLRKGEIVGRTSSFSKPKKILVTRHWRKGGSEVREHVRTA